MSTAFLLRHAVATRPWLLSRWFSSSRACRSGQFTVVVPSAASQQSVLDVIRRSCDALFAQGTAGPDNAAVVLATPALAAWLEDDAFVSRLLGLLPLSAGAASDGGGCVSVLGAVVDGLAPPRTSETVSAVPGLAVMHGDRDALLPGLWAERARRPANRVHPEDVEAAVTVRMPPLPSSTPSTAAAAALAVTVPLAHTVFRNGRRSTLLASRWTAAEAAYRREHTETREHQHIVPPPPPPGTAASPASAVAVPLLALAPPRTIAASLGNIVRQVQDADGGAAVPASRELEAVIPALLAARRAAQPATAQLADGPLGVWALVVPEAAAAQYAALRADGHDANTPGPLQPLPEAAAHAAEAEQQAAARMSAQFTALLAAGCRLHRILSGGGGWGRKQGLLSLDPQMSHPAAAAAAATTTTAAAGPDDSDDEAMLSFIRSFQGGAAEGRTTGQGVDAVAVPGARVQFFVAPQGPAAAAAAAAASRPRRLSPTTPQVPPRSLVLGSASAAADDSTAAVDDDDDAVLLLPNHFGAVAEQGLFVASAPPAGAAIRTKLDVPDAYIHSAE